MSFIVIQCSCGNKQVKEVRTNITKLTLKCVYCNKSARIYDKRKGMFNLNILGLNKNLTEKQAREVLREWKNDSTNEII